VYAADGQKEDALFHSQGFHFDGIYRHGVACRLHFSIFAVATNRVIALRLFEGRKVRTAKGNVPVKRRGV
jgi:hypothetical protein